MPLDWNPAEIYVFVPQRSENAKQTSQQRRVYRLRTDPFGASERARVPAAPSTAQGSRQRCYRAQRAGRRQRPQKSVARGQGPAADRAAAPTHRPRGRAAPPCAGGRRPPPSFPSPRTGGGGGGGAARSTPSLPSRSSPGPRAGAHPARRGGGGAVTAANGPASPRRGRGLGQEGGREEGAARRGHLGIIEHFGLGGVGLEAENSLPPVELKFHSPRGHLFIMAQRSGAPPRPAGRCR